MSPVPQIKLRLTAYYAKDYSRSIFFAGCPITCDIIRAFLLLDFTTAILVFQNELQSTSDNYQRNNGFIFFSINIAWGKFQELNARFRLVLNRKASLRMVCSAQHHLITIFKQQIRGVGRTFHCGEGEGVLRQFLT